MPSAPLLLIVDDESVIVDILSRHFRFRGYEVVTASNGAEALGILKSRVIDIVITDIMMPVMNGVALLRAVRDEYPMVHTIIMTGYVTLDNLLAAMRYGADTCIFKPLDNMEEMTQAVETACASLTTWKRKLAELSGLREEGAH